MTQPKPTLVRTWQSPKGFEVELTEDQERRFRAAGFWPKDTYGQEFSGLTQGPHVDTPTFSDLELDPFIDSFKNGL